MTDMQIKLGRTLLKSLVSMREQKGDLSLEDVGALFVSMASNFNPAASPADQFLHEEIKRLAEYIKDAKKEIFAISTNDKAEDVIMDASQHLDEVIKATETASNSIMDAADTIQANTGGIGGEKEKKIMDATNRIYEACNFQDITGQRITKVIKLLGSIEERITKLNELFGSSPLLNAAAPATPAVITDKDLLNGPQLAGKGSSQQDIDNMLADLGGKK